MGSPDSILSLEIFTITHKYSFYAMKKTDFGRENPAFTSEVGMVHSWYQRSLEMACMLEHERESAK
jgi:hypothetical protein